MDNLISLSRGTRHHTDYDEERDNRTALELDRQDETADLEDDIALAFSGAAYNTVAKLNPYK